MCLGSLPGMGPGSFVGSGAFRDGALGERGRVGLPSYGLKPVVVGGRPCELPGAPPSAPTPPSAIATRAPAAVCRRVVLTPPKQVRATSYARLKTDNVDAKVLADLWPT